MVLSLISTQTGYIWTAVKGVWSWFYRRWACVAIRWFTSLTAEDQGEASKQFITSKGIYNPSRLYTLWTRAEAVLYRAYRKQFNERWDLEREWVKDKTRFLKSCFSAVSCAVSISLFHSLIVSRSTYKYIFLSGSISPSLSLPTTLTLSYYLALI